MQNFLEDCSTRGNSNQLSQAKPRNLFQFASPINQDPLRQAHSPIDFDKPGTQDEKKEDMP